MVDEPESDDMSIEKFEFYRVPFAALLKTSKESEATWKRPGLHTISMVVRFRGIKP